MYGPFTSNKLLYTRFFMNAMSCTAFGDWSPHVVARVATSFRTGLGL